MYHYCFYAFLCINLSEVHIELNVFNIACFALFQQLVQNVLCPDSLKQLFDKCCAKNQKKRPLLSDITKTLVVSTELL